MTAHPVATPHDAPLASPAAGLTRSGRARIDAVDALRGLVIVVMVLDHVRDFFHHGFADDPLALDSGNPALFLTRWVTHLCAPTFVFLAGVSIWLQRANGKPRPDLARFLVTRGLWLIVLELTVVGIGFNLAPFPFLQVIWAIGAAMVAMAPLVWLPRRALLALGVAIVAGHALLTGIDPADVGVFGPLWSLGMEFGPLSFAPGFVAYPFVPWLGVMLAGYGLGSLFEKPPAERNRALLMLAGALMVLFVIVRGINQYGDPRPWAVQPEPLWTVFSFIDVAKYPPSLDYVLVTLGVSLSLLPLLERLTGPAKSVLLTFGRTPLFTYMLHVWIAHLLAVAVGVAMGISPSDFVGLGDPSRLIRAGWGFSLAGVYGAWLLILVILYPLSRGFEGVKRRRRDWWLGYL